MWTIQLDTLAFTVIQPRCSIWIWLWAFYKVLLVNTQWIFLYIKVWPPSSTNFVERFPRSVWYVNLLFMFVCWLELAKSKTSAFETCAYLMCCVVGGLMNQWCSRTGLKCKLKVFKIKGTLCKNRLCYYTPIVSQCVCHSNQNPKPWKITKFIQFCTLELEQSEHYPCPRKFVITLIY